ncbi:MAG: radical SAM protein [bacterium]
MNQDGILNLGSSQCGSDLLTIPGELSRSSASREAWMAKWGQGVQERVDRAYALLEHCEVCPRRCGARRARGEVGFCQAGFLPKVASHTLHFGEEPPLVGKGGSGTIFFSNCNMRCCFCQNYPISQLGVGREVTIDRLAGMMLSLQRRGAVNINFVTPTQYIPQIIAAVAIAKERGLRIPLAYNTNGYERVESLRLLEGIIDIYLPDIKYDDDGVAMKYSRAGDYVEYNRPALKEMYRQVGDLQIDERGVATRGLIVRHLVLPRGLSGTEGALRFVAEELSPTTYVSLMKQYFPAHKAFQYRELRRKVTPREYEAARRLLDKFGLENGWIQM